MIKKLFPAALGILIIPVSFVSLMFFNEPNRCKSADFSHETMLNSIKSYFHTHYDRRSHGFNKHGNFKKTNIADLKLDGLFREDYDSQRYGMEMYTVKFSYTEPGKMPRGGVAMMTGCGVAELWFR
ncbi:MAG: hypothetical protein JKX91_12505 [Rhizobiaceae bacterium]|nr:hypothetical protein [Rhizobiaceae bacterium]